MGKIFGRNCLGKRPPSDLEGWRVIADRKIFFRSRWEYNYACYLQFLKVHGKIIEWAFEEKTFWFEGIKRGTMSYLPDFMVTLLVKEKSDLIESSRLAQEIHEVKGYMDARSATKLKRMLKQYPQYKIVLIDENWFRANAKKMKHIIPGWEVGNKKAY